MKAPDMETTMGKALRTVRFAFDDGVPFDGLTDDTYWNGWLNVRVTPATRDAVVAHLRAEAARLDDDEEQFVGGIDGLPVRDGLVDLGWCYTTSEVDG
jgi:hypothetical protein